MIEIPHGQPDHGNSFACFRLTLPGSKRAVSFSVLARGFLLPHAPRFQRGGYFAYQSLVCAIDPIACVRVRICLSSRAYASLQEIDVQVDSS
jgi:hypothetical protein